MMKRKIFFTDLDGTLLDSKKQISQENREAIEAVRAAGHSIVVATGRSTVNAIQQIRRLQLDQPGCYAITFNGSCVLRCDTGEILRWETLDMDTVRYVFEEARKWGIHCQTYDEGETIAEVRSKELIRYDRNNGGHSRVVPDAPAALVSEPPKVLLAELEDRSRLERFQKEHEAAVRGKADSFFSCKEYLEYVPHGVSKGSAILWLCDYLHIDLADTVAAGDAANDLSMIRTAAVGAAMCNGEQAVKDAADYITLRDNDHSGVAEILKKFVLCE